MTLCRGRSTVTVLRKQPLSVVYSKSCDNTLSAYEHSQELEEQYSLEEYNIVLTLEGTFDILRYLDIINKTDVLYMI